MDLDFSCSYWLPGDRHYLPSILAEDELRIADSLRSNPAGDTGGTFPDGANGVIRCFGYPANIVDSVLEKERWMIELGIPILIIITLLFEMFIPELVPLISIFIYIPVFSFFMVLTVSRSGKRYGKT